MSGKASAPSSALRPSQASAAELVAGGSQIAIPAKQPLGELTQVQYLRRMAEFSAQVPAAAVRFLGVSRNARGNGVVWTVQPYLEGTHPTQAELVADLASQGWHPAGSLHNHLVFEHTPSGVRMHDVHAGNFIRQKSGNLIPIDVFFEGLPAAPS